MKTIVLQEIVDRERLVLGYFYQIVDLPFAPSKDVSLQLKGGATVMPVHIVYDVEDQTLYIVDIVQDLFLGNMPFRDFLDERLEAGWRFKEDIYPEPETMRIKI